MQAVPRIEPLDRSALADAVRLLEAACALDPAAAVAEEKLFGDGPAGAPHALGARDDTGALVGIAAVSAAGVPGGARLRLLAVAPDARGRGVGSALLEACVAHARAGGASVLRTLDEPGNYLAPGIDERNAGAIGWIERRGFTRRGEPRASAIVDLVGNPRLAPDRIATAAARPAAQGYALRRATADEREPLCAAIAAAFGGAWPFEVARALALETPGVHVAVRDGAYCSFAAHDGNNRGLGWFGPAGTWAEHRGRGLGEALLLACLADVVAAGHARCEVAWIGPRGFYNRVAGVAADRRFVMLARAL